MVTETTRAPADVDAEAAAWLARLQGPFRSPQTDAALKEWLKADPAHEAAFERATEIWDLIPGTDIKVEAQASQRSRRPMLAMAAAIAMIFAATAAYFVLMRSPVYRTAVGEQQVAMLDDGTRVSLNTDTRIAIVYSEGERRVRLDHGEALFEVSHDASRPFIVEAGDEQVRALGTTFVVRRDGDERTSVTLLEGRVEVTGDVQTRATRIAVLSPGQRVIVRSAAGAALDRPSIEAVTAWRRGEVVFDDTSLLEAAEELNRYSAAHIRIADPALGALRISGVFSTSDTGEVAQAIAQLHGLRVQRQGSEIQLIR